MKKMLAAAAFVAAGMFALPGGASAASIADAAKVGSAAQGQVERVDFKPWRHCHGPRWHRRCHGARVFFFRDRDRHRHSWRHRHYDRRESWRERRRYY